MIRKITENKKISFMILILLFIFLATFLNYRHTNRYGKFVKTGKMNVSRPVDVKAIRLKDGSVLVLGGEDLRDIGRKTQAEIYNYKTNNFVLGPVFPQLSTVFLLSSGKVLGTTLVFSKERNSYLSLLYNPSTNMIISGPELRSRIYSQQPRPLPNGKVFFFGGTSINSVYNRNRTEVTCCVELYNPTSNAFECGPVFSLSKKLLYQTSTVVLENGNILLVVGSTNAKWYLYDYQKNDLTVISPPKRLEINFNWSGIGLQNDEILFIGSSSYGEGIGAQSTIAKLYNAKNNSILSLPVINKGYTWSGQITKLKNGNVLLTGFSKPVAFLLAYGSKHENISYIYDRKKSRFVSGPKRNYVYGSKGVLLDNGSVLILGASDSKYEAYKNCIYAELFVPK